MATVSLPCTAILDTNALQVLSKDATQRGALARHVVDGHLRLIASTIARYEYEVHALEDIKSLLARVKDCKTLAWQVLGLTPIDDSAAQIRAAQDTANILWRELRLPPAMPITRTACAQGIALWHEFRLGHAQKHGAASDRAALDAIMLCSCLESCTGSGVLVVSHDSDHAELIRLLDSTAQVLKRPTELADLLVALPAIREALNADKELRASCEALATTMVRAWATDRLLFQALEIHEYALTLIERINELVTFQVEIAGQAWFLSIQGPWGHMAPGREAFQYAMTPYSNMDIPLTQDVFCVIEGTASISGSAPVADLATLRVSSSGRATSIKHEPRHDAGSISE